MSQAESSPSASSTGHARNKSSVTRSTRPRSSTKGPLDLADAPLNPLPVAAASPSSQQSPRSVSADQLRRSDSTSRPHSAVPSPGPQIGEARRKNFSFLLRPEIYHPLTPLNVPLSFRHSPHVPDPETPIEELVAHGHFRAAAIAAFQDLTGTGAGDGVDPKDAKRVFELLYTRLACLTLIDATQLAAQEVKALEDLNSVRTYVDEVTGEHLVPWELRVLNVRLQSLGFGDPRRSVMSYYDLAKEAREHIAKNATRSHAPESELWKTRLWDLGIRVAGALIDMEDLSGAAHHLATLPGDEGGKLAFCKALLWLRLGDSERARECARLCSKGVDSVNKEDILLALCDMADANYEAALQRWQEIRLSSDDEMLSINAAVCLLYLGRMPEARNILEVTVDAGRSSHTLLCNLSTMYELCTEKSRTLKTKLADQVAGHRPSTAGWEKLNSDFKL